MFSKTTFWSAVVVAALVVASVPTAAVPVDGDAIASGGDTAKGPESVQTTETSADVTTPTPQPGREGVTSDDELKTPAVDLKLPTDKKTDGPEVPSDVEMVTKPDQPGSTNFQKPVQDPKPYFTGGTVNVGPAAVPPFFLEFFQPFPRQQPPRHHHQQSPHNPFADSQFNPFMDPMPIPSFDQMVNAYANEFRPPGVRNVPKTTIEAIPPVPLLMNIMLNAFRQHRPAEDLLETLEKGVVQMDDAAEIANVEPKKPVTKTTTKTEVINGHVVQTNETTYSDGDEHHKTFYHIKEIQVMPEKPNNEKTATDEQAASAVKESQKEETNEISPDPTGRAVGTVKDAADGGSDGFQKDPGSVSLDDLFQTAAATYRYAPHVPYGVQRPALQSYPRPQHYGRPWPPSPVLQGQRPQAPPAQIVGLHGDTYVNWIAAAQQHASGAPFALPPDVELIDAHGKPARLGGAQYFYNNPQHRNGRGDKFPGRKP